MTPSTSAMQDLIQAEMALRPQLDEAAEAMFTSLRQLLEEYLGNELLPMKDGNEYNDHLQW
jgi:hypothetical protein